MHRRAGRDVRSINNTDVLAVLDAAMRSNTPSAANHARAVVRKFFNGCVERSILATTPCLTAARPAPVLSRDQVLTDNELAIIWAAAGRSGDAFGTIVQLLIRTAQRRGEVAGKRWSELDLEQALWSLAPERTKNNRAHAVALSPRAVSILRAVDQSSDDLACLRQDRHDIGTAGYDDCERRQNRCERRSRRDDASPDCSPPIRSRGHLVRSRSTSR